jgi:putative spermidine/putrescine transport system ATP-binding protein
MPGSPVEIEGLTKRYGNLKAADDVSLRIEAGEFVSLLGSSGSGKTTTLMIIAGFVEADAGTVRIGGDVITGLPPERRNLGVVFQSYALFPNLNVYENIAFPLRMRRQAGGEIARRVGRLLELVELEALKERRITQLSGGQQQRVALARALVYEPPVLLLDEPLGALDRKLRDQLQTELKRVQRELGVTMIYVTHDQEEALSMSDRIAVMAQGRLEQVGSPDEVYERPNCSFVAGFLGESNFLNGPVDVTGETVAIAPPGVEGRFVGRLAGRAPADGRAQAMVRPESLAIGSEAEALPNRLPAEIELREHLGSAYRFSLKTPVGPMTLKLPRTGPAHDLAVGDAITVGWREEDMRVFDR